MSRKVRGMLVAILLLFMALLAILLLRADMRGGGDPQGDTDSTVSANQAQGTDTEAQDDGNEMTDASSQGDGNEMTDSPTSDSGNEVSDTSALGDASGTTEESPQGDGNAVVDASKQGDGSETAEESPQGDSNEMSDSPTSDSGNEVSDTSTPADTAFSVEDVAQLPAGSVLDEAQLSDGLVDELFYASEITEDVQGRIMGISYQENDDISLGELRYLRLLHRGGDGKTHIGELIVNAAIAEDVLEVMKELYAQSYPIEKMVLVDEYQGSDEASMEDNNTSCFNYRPVTGSSHLSQHALGLAIDVNPLFNPYVRYGSDGTLIVQPQNAWDYVDREGEYPYKIAEGDLCLKLFREHGFEWGGDWASLKDYQHFEKSAQ